MGNANDSSKNWVRTLLLVLLALLTGFQVALVVGYRLLTGGSLSPQVVGRDLKDWVTQGPSPGPGPDAEQGTPPQVGVPGPSPGPGPDPDQSTTPQVVVEDSGYLLTSCGTEDRAVAVARVRPSVVYITGHPTSSTSTMGPPGSLPMGTATSDRMGSGVIFDSRGYILTNYHVIANLTELQVSIFGDADSSYPAQLVVTDADADLAVIKISPPFELATATLGNSDMLEPGDAVLAIGCPFNLEQSVTHGITSDTKRAVTIDGRRYVELIQTDASINSGNSGGALINESGELVGINVAIYAPNRVYCGVGFAIPINRAKVLLMKVKYLNVRS